MPADAVCDLCRSDRCRLYARGLCRSCHRKLSGCGVPLPPPRTSGRRREPIARRLARWVVTLDPAVREALYAALGGQGGGVS